MSISALKIIGVIAMLIDHIGLYFECYMNPNVYYICRVIGRIAMPIFAFTLVQGYLHTKDLKKYILRLGILAIITQGIIYILAFVNMVFVPSYTNYLHEFLNIVFSFVLTLILLRTIDYSKKYTQKFNKYINFGLRVITIICIVLYYFVGIDYNYVVPMISIVFFIAEKVKFKVEDKYISIIVDMVKFILMLIILATYNNLEIFSIIDVPLLFWYNGKKYNKFDIGKKFMYIFFPVHNAVLYIFAMLFEVIIK